MVSSAADTVLFGSLTPASSGIKYSQMSNIDYPKYEGKHWGKREAFIQELKRQSGPKYLSALEALDASLWLLSVPYVSQSLSLFHHSIEIAFKALLEEIDALLVVDKLDYDLSKALAQDKIKAHRLGNNISKFVDLENYSPTRSIGLDEAYRRLKDDFLVFGSVTGQQIQEFIKKRNSIVHRGGQEDQEFDYLDLILNVSWPWLQEFYQKAYKVDLSDYIFSPLARELEVARQYLNLTKKDKTVPRTKITHTFTCKRHYDLVLGSANLLFDKDGYQRDLSDWQYELNEENRKLLERKGWDLIGEGAYLSCVICGDSYCIIAISEPSTLNGSEAYYPEAIHCQNCGLFIDKAHKELARLHYGPITEERIGKTAWEKEIPR